MATKTARIKTRRRYIFALFALFGRECYRTWRQEMLASVIVSIMIFLIQQREANTLALKHFGTALLASAITLAVFAIWHFFRTPWLLHINGHDAKAAALFFVLGISVMVCLLVGVGIIGADLYRSKSASGTTLASEPSSSSPGADKSPSAVVPLYQAVTDTITLKSEFDFPIFWAKCSVPCFFNRGVVQGSESKMVEMPRGKDLTVTQVRVI